MKKGYNQYTKKYNVYYCLRDCIAGITNNTGMEFLIDYNDYSIICRYTWNQDDKGYIYTNDKNKQIYLHRLILNLSQKNTMVDHINHNKLDNRRDNLRIVTNSQNQMNRDKPCNNTSGVKGVYWHKNQQKWQANIQINGTLYYLGLFDKKEDAIRTRLDAEKFLFGGYNYTGT